MQKKFFSKLCIVLAAILGGLSLLGGCGKNKENNAPTYTIQYTDDAGLHTLSVEAGEVYALETIPEKFGYDFVGLFDAKTDGTQYVDETGSALSAFTDHKNLVLFPQFQAKEYTLVLDYQGAEITESRSLKVNYDSTIDRLPKNLSVAHKNFTGWYTLPDGQGVQVADKTGVLPPNNKVTEKVFDLSPESDTIYLYAGFESAKYEVTFHFKNGISETLQVEHGTNVKDIIPETRVNGKAVLTWSKQENDVDKQALFTGKITEDLILYAAEYAPVIDFDANGGEAVQPMVVAAGNTLTLPKTSKQNYKFLGWKDAYGNAFTASVMPNESLSLTAIWQAVLVLDENGGTAVEDISVAAGEPVSLPSPTKSGYIFAGWYTENQTQYFATSMPSQSVLLKAGWYKIVTLVEVLQSDSSSNDFSGSGNMYLISFNELAADVDFHKTMKLDVRVIFKADHKGYDIYLGIYSTKEFSDGYLLSSKKKYPHNNTDGYQAYTYTATVTVSNGQFYIGFRNNGGYGYSYIISTYIEIDYPDMETLYL